jgi:hypothetical protein
MSTFTKGVSILGKRVMMPGPALAFHSLVVCVLITFCIVTTYAESERLQSGRKLSRLYNNCFFRGILCIAHFSSASEHLPPQLAFILIFCVGSSPDLAFTEICNLRRTLCISQYKSA